MKNEYLPFPSVIETIQRESFDTKTFKLAPHPLRSFSEGGGERDKKLADTYSYRQGQFAELSLPGIGEAPISITSSPSRKGYLEFTIRSIGKVTKAIHLLKEGDTIYTRGPYGNSFPFSELYGKNIYYIAGGIGLAPLRSLINMVFDNRDRFGKIKILYGAKTPEEICFKKEIEEWKKIKDTEVWLTVDKPHNGWAKNDGVVTELWKETDVHPENAVAVVCGPPIMIKFVVMKLLDSGFKDKDIIMTLERYMKCGIGKCGHCNIGAKFVCIDGPIFTYEQVKTFPYKENAF